jgi:nudix-type nucleoside diphosphatase (YffH/AdpP family)
MAPKIVRTDTVYEGWTSIRVVTIAFEDGVSVRREVEDHGSAVGVLPYDETRRVAIVIRQPRAPVLLAGGGEDVIEIPAGLQEGEDPVDCVRREALEEVGVALGEVELVGRIWAMPGISSERMSLFLAPYVAADRVAGGGGIEAEEERIEVEEIALARLAELADCGELTDLKTFALIQTLRLRRPDLFA